MNKNKSIHLNLIYFKIFHRNADIYFKNENKINDPYIRDCIKRAVLYGVKSFITMEKPKYINEAETNFRVASLVKGFIALLTPGEFMEVFPIKKEYDGHKWQTKDYFYTRDFMNTLNPNEPMGEEALHLLWEYVNTDITLFNVSLLMVMSDLRRLEGYPSIANEWADMEGIKTMTLHEGVNGKDFFIDEQGKIIKINKSKPKYLRVVK